MTSIPVEADLIEKLGRALGPKYQVRRRIGRGGFCDVYEVWDTHLERRLAVKLLRTDLPWGPGMKTRFEREAKALGTLNHINIPPVHFVGDREGLSYFAMSYIEGGSLAELLAESGALDHRRVVELMLPVLDALGHAHRCGIVHRDIKPDNIIIEDGSNRTLLIDFGVAKDLASRPGSSLPGVILGTPAYISPEQVVGESVDHRSDLYAVGSTMFHLLTGRTIFEGEHPRELIKNQLTGEIPVPSELKASIPIWLSSAVLCALERRPADRFQSAAAMAEALRAGLRLEVDAIDWVEPSFAPAPYQGAAVVSRRAGDANPPPWLLVSEDVPGQTERWAVQFRWVVATLVVCLVLTWIGLVPMQLIIRNSMLAPVALRAPRGNPAVVAPGAEYRLGLGRNWNVALRWDLDARDAGAPATDPLSGVLRIEAVDLGELLSRRIHRDLNAWKLADPVLAPRISNHSSGALAVRVLTGQRRGAEVTIAAGSERLLGYYRADDGIGIEVRNARGQVSVLRPGLGDINDETGEYRAEVTDVVFRRASN